MRTSLILMTVCFVKYVSAFPESDANVQQSKIEYSYSQDSDEPQNITLDHNSSDKSKSAPDSPQQVDDLSQCRSLCDQQNLPRNSDSSQSSKPLPPNSFCSDGSMNQNVSSAMLLEAMEKEARENKTDFTTEITIDSYVTSKPDKNIDTVAQNSSLLSEADKEAQKTNMTLTTETSKISAEVTNPANINSNVIPTPETPTNVDNSECGKSSEEAEKGTCNINIDCRDKK